MSIRVCGRLCETGEWVTLTLEAGRIASCQPGMSDASLGAEDVWLAPGFFDLQLNGYAGHDFNLEDWNEAAVVADALPAIFQHAAQAGTALLCPTITTDAHDAMAGRLAALARVLNAQPDLACAAPAIHLEGPYIAPEDGPRGAHPLEHVRDPDWDEFQRFQEAAGGRIRLCTLAPERPGALRFIEHLVEAGIVVALGHAAAEPATIRDAVRAGARLSTHLGNGAHSLLPRHPNYIWEQLAQDELFASIIADGHHLPPAVVKVFARAKGPERLALVSDAVSFGGLAPGPYQQGRVEVLPSGKVVLAGTPYLHGAGHLLDVGVANMLRFTDLSLAQVVRCASAIPAQILGLEARKGQVKVGHDADLTLFRIAEAGEVGIVATLRAGEMVYRAPDQ